MIFSCQPYCSKADRSNALMENLGKFLANLCCRHANREWWLMDINWRHDIPQSYGLIPFGGYLYFAKLNNTMNLLIWVNLHDQGSQSRGLGQDRGAMPNLCLNLCILWHCNLPFSQKPFLTQHCQSIRNK